LIDKLNFESSFLCFHFIIIYRSCFVLALGAHKLIEGIKFGSQSDRGSWDTETENWTHQKQISA